MSNKNNHEPSKETREKIVSDIMSKLEAKDGKLIGDEAELDELIRVKANARTAVNALFRPIVQAAIESSPVDPCHAHSQKGRAMLLMQAQRMYLEQLRTLSRDEAIFLLSLAWAEFTLNEFV